MELLNQSAAAKRLNLAPNTLAQWRVYGRGPKFMKIGRAVRYDPADLQAWLDERKFGSTSEAA